MKTSIDCEGTEQPLDEFHYHELLDRLHCFSLMWCSMIDDHPASKAVLGSKADDVIRMIGECYQIAERARSDK